MGNAFRKHEQDTQMNCSDIFKHEQGLKAEMIEDVKDQRKRRLRLKENMKAVFKLKERHKERKEGKGASLPKLKTALTKGIAGIGKTVSVQKFVLDWAEGKANHDVDFIFVLSFRELNLIKDNQYSLHKLLCAFHPELKDLDPKIYDVFKSVFILDGLDESRIPLNFSQCEKVSDITTTSSLGVLITSLIKGELLPSALLWITSRPSAANQIPPQYINRLTEIQGFSDLQKEEYFRKRISDQDQVQKIIFHIKKARNLKIMCHIPVFCWISFTVLQRIMDQDSDTEIPKTLTEMYSHFLLTQINRKKETIEDKDEEDPEKPELESNRTMLLKLAELAFKQLMKGNVIFYEEDLRESGIDLTEASVYSGMFWEIFREECGIHQSKVYSFIHLSFQEFLAAVYVFHCYENKNIDVLQPFLDANCHIYEVPDSEGYENYQQRDHLGIVSLDGLLKRAVDKAVASPNGHLDLFLRFLLGISLESNQILLKDLLTLTHSSSEENTEYIKKLIKGDANHSLSTEKSICLFLCLSEMKDESLARKIQECIRSEGHSEEKLSAGQCSALAFEILISDEVLDELDLKKYNTSVENYRRLIPAVTVCRKALLGSCGLTEDSLKVLCSALQNANSSLKELDLSNSDLEDSGVELISTELKNSHCKLETLRLAHCKLGGKACENLGSALQSVNSPLKDLDLSNNDLQDSGVELLSAGLKSSHCKLQTLRLSGCMATYEGCSSLASALKSNSSYLRELDLTYNHPGESGVKLLSELLEDPQCKLEKLHVEHSGRMRIIHGLKKYSCRLTLDPNTAHPRLSLSEENRKVHRVEEQIWYLDNSERFKHWEQVLSVESLTGRCYWEVEWSEGGVYVAVSYRGISRDGDSGISGFGLNNQSWSLYCSDKKFTFRHSGKESVALPLRSRSRCRRVGVYLDWPAGTLSFYSISPNTHTLTHLHTIYTTFSEPLHAGFRVDYGSSVWICDIE
uniref:NACHT, LRR and PYD domains-containing protein 12-like n=1 Tax=Astyanax mexicanus TaxID=7994 RepID=A0A8B9K2C3_ASTMX